jgi:hypothetical protein
MIRQFRARVHLFSLEKQRLAEADCLLAVDLQPFTATRWSGVLTNVRPSLPVSGRYLLRFPNGRAAHVDLGADEMTGCPFEGLGTLPMP